MPPLATPTFPDLLAAVRNDWSVADKLFDCFMPREYQIYSRVHWTPLVTAFWLGSFLDAIGARRLLDLGSGPGKLCVAAALASRSCSFVGLEQREQLAAAARNLARRFQVADRVEFMEGALGSVPLPAADVLYCFNPFGENLLGPEEWVDGRVELGWRRHVQDSGLLEDLFEEVPVDTWLVTYHRAGARIPASFKRIWSETTPPGTLRIWRKVRPDSGDRWHLEPGT
jgi:SAM-dependent methyltransferase